MSIQSSWRLHEVRWPWGRLYEFVQLLWQGSLTSAPKSQEGPTWPPSASIEDFQYSLHQYGECSSWPRVIPEYWVVHQRPCIFQHSIMNHGKSKTYTVVFAFAVTSWRPSGLNARLMMNMP